MSSVTVRSLLKVPVELHLGYFIATHFGEREARRVHGSETTLLPGENEVDAGFFRAWASAHRGEVFADHFIAAVEPEEEERDPLLSAPSPWRDASTA